MADKDQYTREQELLMQLRHDRCNDNGAELARKLEMDPTYVNRLFYPIGKKHRKGIGLKLMRTASEKFNLPPGFWEGADEEKNAVFEPPNSEEKELICHWRNLLNKDRLAKLAEIAKLAEERLAEKEELLAKAGRGIVKDLPRKQGSSKQQRRAGGRP